MQSLNGTSTVGSVHYRGGGGWIGVKDGKTKKELGFPVIFTFLDRYIARHI